MLLCFSFTSADHSFVLAFCCYRHHFCRTDFHYQLVSLFIFLAKTIINKKYRKIVKNTLQDFPEPSKFTIKRNEKQQILTFEELEPVNLLAITVRNISFDWYYYIWLCVRAHVSQLGGAGDLWVLNKVRNTEVLQLRIKCVCSQQRNHNY